MQIQNFKFNTGVQHPLPKSGKLIQFIRYVHGKLITSDEDDIAEIIPYPKRKHGGKIIYKNGTMDFYYNIWPITIIL